MTTAHIYRLIPSYDGISRLIRGVQILDGKIGDRRFLAASIVSLVVGVSFATPAMGAESGCDIQAGKKAASMCVACHSFEAGKHMTGPTLHGVIDRPSATAKGFRYSPALLSLNVKWSGANLNEFLLAPQKFAKGTSMAFGGIKDKQKRADLVCYLRSVK